MVFYLDTSALLKRYVAEPESEDVIAKMDDAMAITTAVITRTEVAAALGRASRAPRLDADGAQRPRLDTEDARRAEQEFLEDWADFGRVPVKDDLAAHAGQLAWDHELRGFDAVQLAAALRCQTIFKGLGEQTVFACFDAKLRRAAKNAGLNTCPG